MLEQRLDCLHSLFSGAHLIAQLRDLPAAKAKKLMNKINALAAEEENELL